MRSTWVHVLLVGSLVSACESDESDPSGAPGTAPAVGRAPTPGPNASSPRQPTPSAQPQPAPTPAPVPPRAPIDTVLLTIRLQPALDAAKPGLDFTSDPAPSEPVLTGIEGWQCKDTSSVPAPCGWAKLCGDLGGRWGRQLGADEVAGALETADYLEDCGDDGDVPYESPSGDFIEHGAVIRHATDALAQDGVSELVVQTMQGWKTVARIGEIAIEGMSVARAHEPRASWALELDSHPGKELVLLTTGYAKGGEQPERFGHLFVCRVSPQPVCGRATVGAAKTIELRGDGTLVIDGGSPLVLGALDVATQALIPARSATSAPTGSGGGARCKVSSSGTSYDGPCTVTSKGSEGDFSIAPLDADNIAGANPITVTLLEFAVADVRGLTADGINSRWGEAEPSISDPACWNGDGFSVCVYTN